MFRNLRRWLPRSLSRPRRARCRAPRPPSLEALEGRTLPAGLLPGLVHLAVSQGGPVAEHLITGFPSVAPFEAETHGRGAGSLEMPVAALPPGSTKAVAEVVPDGFTTGGGGGSVLNSPLVGASPAGALASGAPSGVGQAAAGVLNVLTPLAPAVDLLQAVPPAGPSGVPAQAGAGTSGTTPDPVNHPAPADPPWATGPRAGGILARGEQPGAAWAWLAPASLPAPADTGTRLSGGGSAGFAFPAGPPSADAGRAPPGLPEMGSGDDLLADLADQAAGGLRPPAADEPGAGSGAEPLSARDLAAALLTGSRPGADILPAAGSRVNPVVTLLGGEDGGDTREGTFAAGWRRGVKEFLFVPSGAAIREEAAATSVAATEPDIEPPPPAAGRAVRGVVLAAALSLGVVLFARREGKRADEGRAPRYLLRQV